MRAIAYLIPFLGLLYFFEDAKIKQYTYGELLFILLLNAVSTLLTAAAVAFIMYLIN